MTRRDCGKCGGQGQYKIGPQAHDWKRCSDCGGRGYTLELGKMTVTLPGGEQFKGTLYMTQAAPSQPDTVELTDREVAAIHLGRVRLANSAAVKQVTAADGSKSYQPVGDGDRNARMTCEAINVLDELLEPYGYKFGDKMGTELTA